MTSRPLFRIVPLPYEIVRHALHAKFFANPAVHCLHVRSLTYGCFTFKIERA